MGRLAGCVGFLLFLFLSPFLSEASDTHPKKEFQENLTPKLHNKIQSTDVIEQLKQAVHKLETARDKNDKDAGLAADELIKAVEAIEEKESENLQHLQKTGKKIEELGSPEILSKHRRVIEEYEGKSSELKNLLEDLKSAGSKKDYKAVIKKTKKLIDFLENDGLNTKHQLKSSESKLPWHLLEPGEIILLGDSTSISQQTAMPLSSTPPTADDLSPTIDVQITPEIKALADSLENNPLKIFRYVYNNFDYVPYHGSMKGSLDTYWEKEGNDYDLSSLLIALLRASNVPARYVRAKIIVPIGKIQKLVGINDPMSAMQYLSALKVPVLGYYTSATTISHVAIEHIYVEAYVPYSNYRGTQEDDTGKLWIPLDPSLKEYKTLQEGIDIASDMNFSWKSFFDDYIGDLRNTTPIEHYISKVNEHIAQKYPGQTLDSLTRKTEISKMNFDFLPNTIPAVSVEQIIERFSQIPQGLRHYMKFVIDGNIDYTTSLPEIAGKRITLSYNAATPEDQATIDQFGDILKTPPYLIKLKPVLRIGGVTVAEGSSLSAGYHTGINLYYTQPGGGQEIFDHTTTVGSFNAIGLTIGKVRPEFLSIAEVESSEEPYMSKMLHSLAMKYHDTSNQTKQKLNSTMKIQSRTFVNEALVSTSHDIRMWNGIPLTLDHKGFIIDAKEMGVGVTPIDAYNGKKVIDFMMVSGMEASYQENKTFEDSMFWLAGLSATKGLQLLKAMDIPITELTGPMTYFNPNLPDIVIEDINNALNKGWSVMVSEATGGLPAFPYIKYDPKTGSAGYMIATKAGGYNFEISPIGHEIDLTFVKNLFQSMNIQISYELLFPESPQIIAMGDAFLLGLRCTARDNTGITASSDSFMWIDTDMSHYIFGKWPVYALMPGIYKIKFDGKDLFEFDVFGTYISSASDKYLGISTENGTDTVTTPLKIIYSITNVPGLTLDSAVMKVYDSGSAEIRNISLPALLGENQTATWDGKDSSGSIVAPGEYTVQIEATANGLKTASRAHKVMVFKVEITTPVTTEMNISNVPAMPNVTFNATVQPASINLADVTFKWKLETTFRRDVSLNYYIEDKHNVPLSGTDDIVGRSDWTPNWGNLITGGDVKVYVNISIDGVEAKNIQTGYKIKGTQPTKSVIAANLGFNPLRAICCHESDFRQFNCTGDGCIAFPLPCYAHDSGYGLMMLTPASEEQVWNWKTNIDGGISLYNSNVSQSRTHLNYWNDSLSPNPPITMTEEQHMMNTFSLYRSGKYYYGARRVGNTTVYELYRLTGTGPDYADEVKTEMDANTRCRY